MTDVAPNLNALVTKRPKALVAAVCVAGLGVITACGVLSASAAAPMSPEATERAVAAVAGWTRVVTTEHYVIVVNVLPSEHMMTRAEMATDHPTDGELIINGVGQPEGADVRHVEAHVYSRTTGTVLTGITPEITLMNHTTGEVANVAPVLMQDVNIGALDLHFGNNVKVTGNSDLMVSVSVAGEEGTVDGHLD